MDAKVPFSRICLGTRFRYDPDKYPEVDTVWVKIGHNEIAEWDASQIDTNWVGQRICCFSDKEQEIVKFDPALHTQFEQDLQEEVLICEDDVDELYEDDDK